MVTLISLVITVYNRERYLSATIESILTQTYQDFELLIWDDGSSDDSVEIAQHYAAQDQRIKVVAASHQGRASALKAAVSATNSTYLGWVDSDDLLAQTALEETAAVLDTHPDIGLVYTDYLVINEDNSVKEYGPRCRISYSKERLLTDFIVFHFRLMRRRIYDQVGGINELFVCCQDYDLCLKVSEVTDILHLQTPLYYYRHHTASISCQQRVEQIFWGKEAIEQALQRRGMADEYELEIQIFARCSLLHKHSKQSVNSYSQLSTSSPSSLGALSLPASTALTPKYLQSDNFFTQPERIQLLEHVLQQESAMVASGSSTNTAFYPNHRESLVLYSFPQFQELLISRVRAMLPSVLIQLGIPPFPVSQIEVQLTAHNDGHFYKVHNDNASPDTATRVLTYVYYFWREPKLFTGGELLIYDSKIHHSQASPDLALFETVEPRNNNIVFFHSGYMHEVKTIHCPSNSFADSRFTINGWIRC